MDLKKTIFYIWYGLLEPETEDNFLAPPQPNLSFLLSTCCKRFQDFTDKCRRLRNKKFWILFRKERNDKIKEIIMTGIQLTKNIYIVHFSLNI